MITVVCALIILLFGGYFDSANRWSNSDSKL